MKKSIRCRLEKALITLQEPEGSTVRSIIKTINKEPPALSLKSLLEALEEGISQGILCMYNGRFKLKSQINSENETELTRAEKEASPKEKSERRTTPSEADMTDEESELDLEDEEDEPEMYKSENDEALEKKGKKPSREIRGKSSKRPQRFDTTSSNLKKRQRSLTKEDKNKLKFKGKRSKKNQNNLRMAEKIGSSFLEWTSRSTPRGNKSGSTAKLDLKKQRGPRCTSMKKDVRMPSKVHIPFVPPSVPQRNNNFNDLLRRSPDPVNGPLFDTFSFNNENPELFWNYNQMSNFSDSFIL